MKRLIRIVKCTFFALFFFGMGVLSIHELYKAKITPVMTQCKDLATGTLIINEQLGQCEEYLTEFVGYTEKLLHEVGKCHEARDLTEHIMSQL